MRTCRTAERINAYYDRLWRDQLTVDFAHPEADLSAYKLIVAPASYLLTRKAADNLRRYVEGGGTLVVSYFSAIVNEHDAVHAGGFVAPLREVLGLTVEEFLPLRAGEKVALTLDGITGDVWTDDIALAGAEVVAAFEDGPAAGKPAITRNELGGGSAWYVSTRLDADQLSVVLDGASADAGLKRGDGPEDLELVRRHGAAADYLIAINHGTKPAELPVGGTDLLSGEQGESLKVEPGGARVVRLTSP